MHNLIYIKRKDLDVARWDNCIAEASNGLIYAYSYYLDAVCDNWDALVWGPYEAVMPLPWRKKWGIKYVYQPPFLQKLGIFGKEINATYVQAFFEKAAEAFSLVHYNTAQPAPGKAQKELENFFLDLSTGYQTIHKNYSSECVKNIRKALARGCTFTLDINAAEVIAFFKNAYGQLHPQLGDPDYQRFKNLVHACQTKGSVLLAGVKDEKENKLFCAALFKDAKRLYYVLGAPSAEGRQKRAPYFFIDAVLQQHSGQPLLFDFEGSVIPSVASFYKKFSPAAETYYEVKINRRPPPLKWLK